MAHSETLASPPRIRRVALERPWAWLAAGWRDIWRAPHVSLTYGALFAAISLALTVGLFLAGLEYLLPPLAAGFMLVGPMLAVGLYETSRRLQAGEPVTLRAALLVATRSPTQLAFLGILLMLILLAWMRLATLLFALFFGTLEFPPLPEITQLLFFTWPGLGLLVVGTAVGAVLAAIVFAISVVSVPMLMVREVDAITAMVLSVRTVRANLAVLTLWAWLIIVLTVCGLVPAYLGLIVTFPLVGHATWHAYRDLIDEAVG
ncbi:MAG: DUF2189 domain-containing protein [Kiloniellaceae bacterium]